MKNPQTRRRSRAAAAMRKMLRRPPTPQPTVQAEPAQVPTVHLHFLAHPRFLQAAAFRWPAPSLRLVGF